MSKAEETKKFIVETTASLFNKRGYAGTSLSDITEATGLTKGSIYGNFENKEDIALAVYRFNTKRLDLALEADLAAQTTASGKLKAFTEYYRNGWKRLSERGGCPLMNAAVEADDNLPFLQKEVQGSFKKLSDKIVSIIETGIRNKEFRKDISPVNYAYTFLMLIEGSILLSKIENNPKHLKTAADRILSIIEAEIKI